MRFFVVFKKATCDLWVVWLWVWIQLWWKWCQRRSRLKVCSHFSDSMRLFLRLIYSCTEALCKSHAITYTRCLSALLPVWADVLSLVNTLTHSAHSCVSGPVRGKKVLECPLGRLPLQTHQAWSFLGFGKVAFATRLLVEAQPTLQISGPSAPSCPEAQWKVAVVEEYNPRGAAAGQSGGRVQKSKKLVFYCGNYRSQSSLLALLISIEGQATTRF